MKNKEGLLRYIDMCQASLAESTSNDYIQNHGIDGETFDFKETDVEGFWMEDVDSICVVFRSTELTTKEILENFNFLPKNGFHRGVANKVSDDLFFYVLNLKLKTSKPLFFIGHSLGGAIARYFGYKTSVTESSYKVYTFGTYSTTRKDFSFYKMSDAKHYNYMVSNDKVGLLGKIFAFFCGYKDIYIYLKKKGFYSMENHNLVVYREVIENA